MSSRETIQEFAHFPFFKFAYQEKIKLKLLSDAGLAV